MSDSSGMAAVRFQPPRDGAAYVVGTFDTKARELGFLADLLRGTGLRVVTVDVSTARGHASAADVSPATVAERHPGSGAAVFGNDRGRAIEAMATALAVFLPERADLAGVIAAGGSGGTALATHAMQSLPVGLPKIMVSTVAAGDVKRYVGATDICLMPSVTDVSGLNRISTRVLGNAAHALAGMIGFSAPHADAGKPAIGLTMFGVTTPCVQSVAAALEAEYDCIVFHATGTGGQAMEKLVDSGLLAGVIDITTTEIADHLLGGVLSAGEGRLDAIIRTTIPYVGSCGALDMVNFGARDTVPEKHSTRNLYVHNPQVTLMRTLPEENARLGAWIAAKLNRMQGEVRFLLPLGGVSLIDSPGQPFHDPTADRALFDAIRANFNRTDSRRLIELPHEINHPAFAAALVDAFRAIAGPAAATRSPSS